MPMQALIALFFLPLMLLNLVGGIVGYVWLVFLGEWSVVGIALLATILGTFACGLALAPGLLVSVPAIAMFSRGGVARIASFPLMLIGLAWTFAVMCVWAIWWFMYFLGTGLDSVLPALLVAYSVATGPWVYMAQKEAQDGSGSAASTAFFLQVACALALVMLAFFGAHPMTALVAFVCVMGLALIFNVIAFLAMAASAGRDGVLH